MFKLFRRRQLKPVKTQIESAGEALDAELKHTRCLVFNHAYRETSQSRTGIKYICVHCNHVKVVNYV